MSRPAHRRARLPLALLTALVLATPTLAQDSTGELADETAGEIDGDAGPAMDEGASIAANDPALLDAEMMPRAADSLLLDAVRTNAGFIAVGERGHVVMSDDGRNWKQAKIPTRATLTTIASADGILWAGGHDGVIVHSTDGGQTWTRRRAAPWSPETFDPSEGVPVLDLLFTDSSHGFAVGAYSLMLVTEDGGISWTPRSVSADSSDSDAGGVDGGFDDAGEGEDWTFDEADLTLDAESDPHFNAIARAGSGALVIAGERGAFLRSRDGGETWESRRLPYEGSMFGVLAWDDDHILVFGLRGNVYESTDLGDSWTRVETGTTASLMGGAALPSGGAVLVGANGVVLTRANAQTPFTVSVATDGDGIPQLAAVVPAGDDGFLVVGEMGADLYRPQ